MDGKNIAILVTICTKLQNLLTPQCCGRNVSCVDTISAKGMPELAFSYGKQNVNITPARKGIRNIFARFNYGMKVSDLSSRQCIRS